MEQEKEKEKEEFDNAINYFQSIISSNISKYSRHKMGATFIGIKTNISGTLKMHIYILFFPFPYSDTVVPYSKSFSNPNIYFKDLCFNVCESFYLWLYEEMKRQNSIVIMSLESKILKVIPRNGDTIINVDINCNEKKEWMELEYDAWYEKKSFNNVFTIKIVNPYLYMVPFPVNPIIIQTVKKLNNYVEIMQKI
jgi:hypothetical protein